VRSEGFYVNEKIPMTPAGIEPETFQFVAQRLNHCATAIWNLQTYTNSGAKINFVNVTAQCGVLRSYFAADFLVKAFKFGLRNLMQKSNSV